MKKSIAIIITAIILFAGCSLDDTGNIHDKNIVTTNVTSRGSNDGFVLPVCNKASCPNRGQKMTQFYKSIFKDRKFNRSAKYDCEHCDYFHDHTKVISISLNIYKCTGCGNTTGGTKEEYVKCTSSDPNRVDFPDYRLECVVRDALHFGTTQRITKNDLLTITVLDEDYGYKIETLDGLQFCKNLERIYFHNDSFSDLSPLKDLQKLYIVIMTENKDLVDLSPLKDLPNLEHLTLNNCSISDLSPLQNIYSLYDLEFKNNNLTNIDSLSKMRLAYVDLSGNKIKKLPKLRNHKFMWTFDFSNNEITDISNLNGTWIKDINLNNNNIKDISSLKNNDKLEEVYIENNNMNITRYSNNKKVIDSLINRPTPCKVTWKKGNRI